MKQMWSMGKRLICPVHLKFSRSRYSEIGPVLMRMVEAKNQARRIKWIPLESRSVGG